MTPLNSNAHAYRLEYSCLQEPVTIHVRCSAERKAEGKMTTEAGGEGKDLAGLETWPVNNVDVIAGAQ